MRELKHDPVVDTEEYKMVVDEVDKKAKKRVDAVVQALVDD